MIPTTSSSRPTTTTTRLGRTDADRHVEDASLHARLSIPASATETGETLIVCVSKFGRLATVAVTNPGASSQDEFEERVAARDAARIYAALDSLGARSFPKRLCGRTTTGRGRSTQPLGNRVDLIDAIREVCPTADFSDPSWGELATPDFVIEFNMGSKEVVDSMMLHVRGGGPVVDFIDALLTRRGRRTIDCSEGEFLSPATSAESLRSWQMYRDSVIEPT